MITIQSGMLIALGFLAASLLGLLFAPAFWSRAVRLTTRRLKQTIPLSEMEIEADRDRIRAEYAIKMHKLETLVEQVKLAGARQQIEINRRDARINTLEADLERLKASYEEAQNARRVLEQTIADRLPKVEGRLTEVRRVLYAREREVEELTQTVERQVKALSEASGLNDRQRIEIEQLGAALTQRGGRSEAQRAEAEAALKAEVETLRGKVRDQAQALSRLQSLAARSTAGEAEAGEPAADGATAGAAVAQPSEADRRLQELRARTDDQAAEIARLKAAIAVFEQEADAEHRGAGRETRVALRAKLTAIEAQSTQQTETIVKLRGELAAANERLARQAQHFTGELRRLGASPSGRARRSGAVVRPSLAERVALAKGAGDGEEAAGNSAGEAEANLGPSAEAATGIAGVASPLPDEAAGSPAPVDSGDASAAPQPVEAVVAAGGRGRPRLLDRIAGLSRSS